MRSDEVKRGSEGVLGVSLVAGEIAGKKGVETSFSTTAARLAAMDVVSEDEKTKCCASTELLFKPAALVEQVGSREPELENAKRGKGCGWSPENLATVSVVVVGKGSENGEIRSGSSEGLLCS
jgi:hypothetical protein